MRDIRRWLRCGLVLLLAQHAGASGPRFLAGPPYFTANGGQPIGWKQTQLNYFTDPGSLGPSVDHAASDALVAAAVGVWNLPMSSVRISQGGQLAEHVSGQNVYLDSAGMMFPTDAMAANAAAIPIAVIYDTDGSITDLLLGSGASDPSGCRQNGVTNTIDWFDPAGYIGHAMIVINGRCSGAAPEMQLELRYQLMRAFGRVLGLAWSQTNDNVFTGTPQPTPEQELHWPVMHPMDIICGPYSYACMLYPFQLRPDDIGSMAAVYGNGLNASLPAGGNGTYTSAAGSMSFPTGEGMAGVNMLVRRQPNGAPAFEGWFETSAVTGTMFNTNGSSPFVAPDIGPAGSFGGGDGNRLGYFFAAYVPIDDGEYAENLEISSEAVNPLYRGSYSLGPYAAGPVAPSGSPPVIDAIFISKWGGSYTAAAVPDAAATCSSGEDGTVSAPMTAPATGWWRGLLCAHGHTSYVAAEVKESRTFTIEVTALDVNGIPTEGKAMPVIGLFAASDGWGALPSLGLTPVAFQSVEVGMTTLHAATNQATAIRFGIADQRGDGRPDYPYQARLLYADRVAPAQVPAIGGQITVSGMGFRAGNAVTINGVAAAVVSWTPTTIVATAPAMAMAHAGNGAPLDLEVWDLSTGATSTMTGAIAYNSQHALPNSMRIVDMPTATGYTGVPVSIPFAVRVVAPDGVTPVVGDAVTFSATGAGVQFAACGGPVCVVATDATGTASTSLTPRTAGTATLVATDGALMQSASFPVLASAGSIVVQRAPAGNVFVGEAAAVPFAIQVLAPDGVTPMGGRTIAFTVPAGAATFSGCVASVCALISDSQGQAQVYVTPTALGAVSIQAADGSVSRGISFTAVPDPDVMTITSTPAASVYVGSVAGQFNIELMHGDGSGPDLIEPITFTAPVGITMNPCGSNTCTVYTNDWNGTASANISVMQPGTFTIQAAFGSVTQSVTVTGLPHTRQIVVLSAPSGNVPIGTIDPTPFTLQMIDDGAIPVPNLTIDIEGLLGVVATGICGWTVPSCEVVTDGNGIVSTLVEPLASGAVSVTAVYAPDEVTATFIGVGLGRSMTVVEQPGPSGVWVGDTVNLAVQVLGPGGTTPVLQDNLNFEVLSGQFSISNSQNVIFQEQTDQTGTAPVQGWAAAPGVVSILVTDGLLSLVITFTASIHTDTMQLIRTPVSGATVGTMAQGAFQVQVLQADGTPAAGRNITIGALSGSAQIYGCWQSTSCVMQSDSSGMVTVSVIPLSAGTIVLSASEVGAQQTASFTAVGPVLVDKVSMTSTPGPSVYVGAVSAQPLQLQVLLADGVTPVAGVGVALSQVSSGGTVMFNACPASPCTLVTDAHGVATTLVTGATPGALALVATANLPTGAQTLSTPFLVVANQFSVTAINPQTYVYAGAQVGVMLRAVAIENGNPAVALAEQWAGATGLVAITSKSVTDALGMSAIPAVLGPLAAAATASASVCAWTSICAQFAGTGVAAQDLSLMLVSGGQQTVTGAAAALPVVAMVVDSAGHPVVAAPVSIYQEVTALEAACPTSGRCPAAPVLASQATVTVSASDGSVTIVPQAVSGVATRTKIALAAGTAGFATAVVSNQP